MLLAYLLLACGPSTPEEWEAVGDDVERTEEERAAAWTEACREGRVEACVKLARADWASESERSASAEVACEAGDAEMCGLRSEVDGDHWQVTACEGGHGPSCLGAALGAGTPRERARWQAQACHAGETSACLPSALAWRTLGERTRSAALYGVACASGQTGACWLQSQVREEAARVEACEGGDEPACEEVCLRDGLGCEEVVSALEQSCGQGQPVACTRRGLVASDRGDADAGDWLWRGCDRVDPWACLLLADRVEAGMPLPDKARGDVGWLRNQACDLQLDYGCALIE